MTGLRAARPVVSLLSGRVTNFTSSLIKLPQRLTLLAPLGKQAQIVIKQGLASVAQLRLGIFTARRLHNVEALLKEESNVLCCFTISDAYEVTREESVYSLQLRKASKSFVQSHLFCPSDKVVTLLSDPR